MKYKLSMHGFMNLAPKWCEPRRARLPGAPKWLRRYKFITHRNLDNQRLWNLTECSTGRAVSQYDASRKAAIKAGLERILKNGCARFRRIAAEAKAK